jgi:putative peptidoglycan lipid II flippase
MAGNRTGPRRSEAIIAAPSIARSTATMSVSTLVSRMTGFVRTWAMAVALGVTMTSTGAIPVASSFNISNNIPNMIYELFAGGVLSAMLIPIFMERLEKDGQDGAFHFIRSLFNVVLVVLGLLALVGTFFPFPFVRTQTFTVKPAEVQLAVYFFRFFAVQIVFYGLMAITTGVLNSYRHFFAPAIAPVLNNIVVIIALLGVYIPLRASHPMWAVTALAVATTLGVVALLVVQLPVLLKLGFRFGVRIDFRDPSLRKLGVKMLPILLYVATNLVGVSFRNAYATSAFRDGSAVLTYAWMWYQLPYGVFAVALITALVPELSGMAARTEWSSFKATFGQGLRALGVLIMPMAAMLIALAGPLVTLYRVGNFPQAAVPLVSSVLMAWTAGLFSFCAFMFVLRTFHTMQDSLTPSIVNVFVTILQIALYAGLTGVLAWGNYRLLGVPTADAIAYTLNVTVLMIILRRRIGAFDGRRIFGTLGVVLAASLLGGGAAWGVSQLVSLGLHAGRFAFLGQIAAGGLVGLAVSYGVLAALRVPEMAIAASMARRVAGRLMPGKASS